MSYYNDNNHSNNSHSHSHYPFANNDPTSSFPQNPPAPVSAGFGQNNIALTMLSQPPNPPQTLANPIGFNVGGRTLSSAANVEASMRLNKRKRRKHKNSHNGCSMCKKRKVRCDETLPKCINCRKMNLQCPYLELSPKDIERIKKQQVAEEKARMVLLFNQYYNTDATVDNENPSNLNTSANHSAPPHLPPVIGNAPQQPPLTISPVPHSVYHQHHTQHHQPPSNIPQNSSSSSSSPPPPPPPPHHHHHHHHHPSHPPPHDLHLSAPVPYHMNSLSTAHSIPLSGPHHPQHHHPTSVSPQVAHPQPGFQGHPQYISPQPSPHSQTFPVHHPHHHHPHPHPHPRPQHPLYPSQVSYTNGHSTTSLNSLVANPLNKDNSKLSSPSKSSSFSEGNPSLADNDHFVYNENTHINSQYDAQSISGSESTSVDNESITIHNDFKTTFELSKVGEPLPCAEKVSVNFSILDHHKKQENSFLRHLLQDYDSNLEPILTETYTSGFHSVYNSAWIFSMIESINSTISNSDSKVLSHHPDGSSAGEVLIYICLHFASFLINLKSKRSGVTKPKKLDYLGKVYYGNSLKSLRIRAFEKLSFLNPHTPIDELKSLLNEVILSMTFLPFAVLCEEGNASSYIHSLKSGVGLLIELIHKKELNDKVNVMNITSAKFLFDNYSYSLRFQRIHQYDSAVLDEFLSLLVVFKKLASNYFKQYNFGVESKTSKWFWDTYTALSEFATTLKVELAKIKGTIYPISIYFSIVKDWCMSAPLETLIGNNSDNGDNSMFSDILKEVLYLFYRAFSITLGNLFPKIKYYFCTGFSIADSTFSWNPRSFNECFDSFFITSKNANDRRVHLSLEEEKQFGNRVSLKDISIYLIRITSFFQNRLNIWIDICLNMDFADTLSKVAGISEVPILKFYNKRIQLVNYPHFKTLSDMKSYFDQNELNYKALTPEQITTNKNFLEQLLTYRGLSFEYYSNNHHDEWFDHRTFNLDTKISSQDFCPAKYLYKPESEHISENSDSEKVIRMYESLRQRKIKRSRRPFLLKFTKEDLWTLYNDKEKILVSSEEPSLGVKQE